jgi:hypothetical protein
MRIIGGFDKNILRAGPAAIEAEIYRLKPLVEEGGFIPHCDHLVPPDVPYAHYLHYLRLARHVWGRDTNLRPAAAPELACPLGSMKTAGAENSKYRSS